MGPHVDYHVSFFGELFSAAWITTFEPLWALSLVVFRTEKSTWVRRWLSSLRAWEYDLSQCGHWFGFVFMWENSCVFRWATAENTRSQPGKEHRMVASGLSLTFSVVYNVVLTGDTSCTFPLRQRRLIGSADNLESVIGAALPDLCVTRNNYSLTRLSLFAANSPEAACTSSLGRIIL